MLNHFSDKLTSPVTTEERRLARNFIETIEKCTTLFAEPIFYDELDFDEESNWKQREFEEQSEDEYNEESSDEEETPSQQTCCCNFITHLLTTINQ